MVNYSAKDEWAGAIVLQFTYPPQYRILACTTDPIDISSELPTAIYKVWRITLTKTSGIYL